MKINLNKWTRIAASILLFSSIQMSAQKLFTLEDLNFGGTNYHNLQPKNMWLAWWGDQLIQTDVEECYTIDAKTGKKSLLFTLEDINKWAKNDKNNKVRTLTSVSFPYPHQPIVMVRSKQGTCLLDFKKKETVWMDSVSMQTAYDWSASSKATAYVKDDQLFLSYPL